MGIPISILEQLAGKVEVRSATNPLLWLTAVIIIPSLSIIAFVPFWIQIILVIIILLLLFCNIGCYIFFMIKNPDYLRSEKFHIQKQALNLLGDQSKSLSDEQQVVLMEKPETDKLIESD
jgi:hypothetical protein